MSSRSQGAAPLRVAVRTLGCKVNRVESERILAQIVGDGAVITAEADADVVIVDTCTVTLEADAKSRKAVRHALRHGGRPLVVVTGCMAGLEATALNALGDRVVVEPDKTRVALRVVQSFGGGGRANSHGGSVERVGEGFRTRAMVKLQDGCDTRCAYCIVPDARGRPRSEPLSDVLAEVCSLVEAGSREVVLTGVNLGKYGDSGADLAQTVREIARSGVERLRLSSIEPLDLTDRLLEILAETPAVCEHLHVPLQSGSDAVLSAMRRGYALGQYLDRIEAARDALPGLALTTDVMVGFPGESDADAQQTVDACVEIGFARLHVFRFSARPGTPAAEMSHQVPAEVRGARAATLRETGGALHRRHLGSAVGTLADVLAERCDHEGRSSWVEGTTRRYQRVRFASGDVRPGDSVRVMVDGVAGNHLEGRLVRDRIEAVEQGRHTQAATASRNGTEVR